MSASSLYTSLTQPQALTITCVLALHLINTREVCTSYFETCAGYLHVLSITASRYRNEQVHRAALKH